MRALTMSILTFAAVCNAQAAQAAPIASMDCYSKADVTNVLQRVGDYLNGQEWIGVDTVSIIVSDANRISLESTFKVRNEDTQELRWLENPTFRLMFQDIANSKDDIRQWDEWNHELGYLETSDLSKVRALLMKYQNDCK